MKTNIYIIHGFTASSQANWFPWIKDHLKSKGFDIYIPDMPNSNDPNCSEWLKHLDNTFSNINNETIFIGHSLGCVTAMKFILKNNIKIKAAVFVSGFIDENPMDIKTDGLQSFFTDSLDIKNLINLVPNRIAITALDDDIVPSIATKNMAEKIDAELIELNCGKHFIDRDGYTEFPILLNIIEKI